MKNHLPPNWRLDWLFTYWVLLAVIILSPNCTIGAEAEPQGHGDELHRVVLVQDPVEKIASTLATHVAAAELVKNPPDEIAYRVAAVIFIAEERCHSGNDALDRELARLLKAYGAQQLNKGNRSRHDLDRTWQSISNGNGVGPLTDVAPRLKDRIVDLAKLLERRGAYRFVHLRQALGADEVLMDAVRAEW